MEKWAKKENAFQREIAFISIKMIIAQMDELPKNIV